MRRLKTFDDTDRKTDRQTERQTDRERQTDSSHLHYKFSSEANKLFNNSVSSIMRVAY